MIAILIALSGDVPPSYACDYSYAARINGRITHASMTVQAASEPAARGKIRRIVEASGNILEGCACRAK